MTSTRVLYARLAWVLALLTAGCGSGGKYQVAVSFDASLDPSKIETVELMLVDQCPTDTVVQSGAVPTTGIVSRIVLINGATSLPTFGNVPAGTYGLYARGIDSTSCAPMAAACTMVPLTAGGSETLSIQLAPLTTSAASICNAGDICIHGQCSSTQGTCTAQSPDGAPCTDDPGYNGVCRSGQCIVSCVDDDDCNDANPCNGTETCDASNGSCVAGSPLMCDDGNMCNGLETCTVGVGCQPGTPPNCDDGNPCTADACDSTTGCMHTPLNDLRSCTNGAGKNGDCENGQCVALCMSNADCDDGNVCNGTETCDTTSSKCQPGTPLSCDDGNVCNGIETCDPTLGCQAGVPLNCNDNNQCTKDSCDSITGCHNDICLVGCAPPWWTPCG